MIIMSASNGYDVRAMARLRCYQRCGNDEYEDDHK
jgi:hypothetical protein